MIGAAGDGLKQTTFSSLAWNGKKKTTRREGFLAEMNQVIPWDAFIKRIEPVFPKAGAPRVQASCRRTIFILDDVERGQY